MLSSYLQIYWCFFFFLSVFLFLPVQISATLAIPFWQWFLTRFGKKMAAYVGSLVKLHFLSRSGVASKIWEFWLTLWLFIFFPFFLTVCRSLHDHGGVRTEKPHHHLLRVFCLRRGGGCSLPAALVKPPNANPWSGFFLFIFFILALCGQLLRTGFCSPPPQVHAARRRRRFPGPEPGLHGTRSHLLFLLRFLH